MTRAAAVGGAPDDSAAATPPQAGTLDARLAADLLALLAEEGDGGVGDGDGDGVGGGRTIVRSPLTREELARVPHTTARGVAAAFARARAAQRRWARLPARTRSRVLLRFHDLLVTRQDTVMEVVTAETGKARRHAFDEVLHLALTARYYARTGARQVRSRGARGAIPGLTRVRVHQVPKGVVGVISPWNYPFTLASCDGLAAVMAGNAVVLKPDERTMLSALIGKRLLVEAGMPEDLWQIVAGPGPSVGQELISHADHVCFTGSVATGRVVARQCAERLIGCSLELGGKNAFVVLRDADLDKAAEGAVRAAFPNAGQLCVSSERFYVDRAVLDAFVDRFVARTRAMVFTGDGSWENAMGSLISRDQLDKVATHVEDAVVKGATVLTGGAPRPEHGPYFFEPTILTGVTADMECHLQETFGPVVAVHPFDDERAVLGQVNAGDMGLNASVFGGRRARAFARGVVAGTVNINEGYAASFASIDSPMGGMRQSGLGRRQGREGILRFTEPQAVARQYVTRFGPADGMSVERYARLMTLSLRVLRRLRRA
ncbi:succinic semialdehyde dehydrogenase [Streptomyces sp. NPDC091377]|uniref:succinic semialdehyde dehydrogenase n=1 Tax=Streptomyces sp. NPDC091377 TaxID=3365995 RepID=UPI003808442E